MICNEHLISQCGSAASVTKVTCVGAVCLQADPQQKPWTTNLGELSWHTTFHTSCHSELLEESGASCVALLGEDSWKHAPGFLHASSPVPLPFADFSGTCESSQ